jgi:hypothetical protein
MLTYGYGLPHITILDIITIAEVCTTQQWLGANIQKDKQLLAATLFVVTRA